MKNKTCKECKHFEVDTVSAVCEKKRWICDDDAPACNRFEQKPKMTNGDKIRQMSNEELAEKLVFYSDSFNKPAKLVNGSIVICNWKSLITGKFYWTKNEALAATIEKLKEVTE